MTRELECPFCNGSGREPGPHAPDEPDTCEYCGGFGTLPVLDLDGFEPQP